MRRRGQNRPRSRPTTTRITRYRYSECNYRCLRLHLRLRLRLYLNLRHVRNHALTSTSTLISTYMRHLTELIFLMAHMAFMELIQLRA